MKSNYQYKVAKQKRDNIKRGYVPLGQGVNNHNREPGWKSLACAVLEQAVSDYFILVRNGYVKRMRRTGKRFEDHGVREKTHCQYIYADDISHLLNFLNGSCKPYIHAAMYGRDYINFDAELMRAGILKMEEMGNIGA